MSSVSRSLWFLSFNLLLWGSVFIGATLLFIYRQSTFIADYGMNEIAATDSYSRAMTTTLACFGGILSKSLHESATLQKEHQSFSQIVVHALSPSKVLVALIASPIALAAIYGKVAAVDDNFLAFLIAYQAGFFFQTVTSPRAVTVRKT